MEKSFRQKKEKSKLQVYSSTHHTYPWYVPASVSDSAVPTFPIRAQPGVSMRLWSEIPSRICPASTPRLGPLILLPHGCGCLVSLSFSSITQASGLSLFVTSYFRPTPVEMYTVSTGEGLMLARGSVLRRACQLRQARAPV